MSWGAVAAAGVGVVGGMIASNNQSGAGGSVSNQVTPASWDSISSGSPLGWMDLMASLDPMNYGAGKTPTYKPTVIGSPSSGGSTYQHMGGGVGGGSYLYRQPYINSGPKYSDDAFKKNGKWYTKELMMSKDGARYELTDVEARPINTSPTMEYRDVRSSTPMSLQDIMTAKLGYQNTGYNNIYNDMMRTLQSSTGAYEDRVGELSRPAFNIGVGDQTLGIVPKRNSMLADMAGNVMAAQKSDLGASTEMRLAALDRFYPGAAREAYLNAAFPLYMQMQGMRYGTPSSTQTATMQPSMLQSVGQGLQLANSAYGLYNQANQQPPAAAQPAFNWSDYGYGDYIPA